MSKNINSDKCEELSENLFRAINNDDITAVKIIFSNKDTSPWEYKNHEGLNSLQMACFNNYTTVVLIILEQMSCRLNTNKEVIKTFVNEKTDQGFTPLLYASFRGNIDIIKCLIDNGAILTETNNKGLDIMHMAAQGDQASSLVFFKEKYNFKYDTPDIIGSTPLHWACYSGNVFAFSFLMSFENININCRDNEGLTPLHLAILSDKTRIIKKLLRKGANKEIKDNKGKTPSDLAIEKRKKLIINMLNDDADYCSFWYKNQPLKKLVSNNYYVYFYSICHLVIGTFIFVMLLPIINDKKTTFTFIILLIIVIILYCVLFMSDASIKKNTEINFFSNLVENKGNIHEYCALCAIKKLKYTKHCYICNKCIDVFDHHCFWINNCIVLASKIDENDKLNLKTFPPKININALYSRINVNIVCIIIITICTVFLIPVASEGVRRDILFTTNSETNALIS